MDCRVKPGNDEKIPSPRHPEEPRILRGVSKDAPQALAAILRDAAKRPLLRMTGNTRREKWVGVEVWRR
jgi:hypothetical protein